MSSGRHAILTGAGGGIGRAAAAVLAPMARAMVLVARDERRLATLRDELSLAHPGLHLTVVAGDLTDRTTRARVRDAAQALPGPPDLLVNNAGINEFRAFESHDAADVARLLEVNLVAPMQLTRELLPLLLSAPAAQIVNVGSVYGYLGYPGFAAYCASKFGLRGFSEALRRELSDTAVDVRYFAPRAARTAANGPAVAALNRELGVREDAPEAVARELLKFLGSTAAERRLGFPERLYVLVNQLLPRVTDAAIRGQLPTIRKHLTGGALPEGGPALRRQPAK
jgi:short-subunit dehydrogenase